MTVSRALARFTDDVYRMQTGLLEAALAAPYEPASLRAQAYTARLAYKQSVFSYVFAWKQLVAVVGLRQLPLSTVEGHIDRLIPYFDYDTVLHHVLNNHTDVLTARNAVDIGRYNLKLAQVTPLCPDVDVNVAVLKDTTLAPFGTYHQVSVGMPLPVWDLNKGNIIAAQAGLLRASEESHRVEVALTNNFAAAYVNYKNNLEGLEYYRRFILPDQVRAYRGIYARRQIDPASAFGDLVQAQQTLAANVTSYLGILNSLWSSVVTVADFLQTDDLFQAGQKLEVPGLPDLNQLPPWSCPHPGPISAECPTAPVMAASVTSNPVHAPTGAWRRPVTSPVPNANPTQIEVLPDPPAVARRTNPPTAAPGNSDDPPSVPMSTPGS
jgi:cobalt-zinc-cadmium efflux system outer membrane protein